MSPSMSSLNFVKEFKMKKECALLQLEGTMEKNLKMKIFNYYRRISMCLEFMSYSLIVNSEKVRPIVLGHGLR